MDEISSKLTKFIHKNFETIYDMRVLLLLCLNPDEEWDAWKAGSRLSTKPDTIQVCLANLQAKGLLEEVKGKDHLYKYAPTNAKMDGLVREVLSLDQTQPVTLINLVYSRPKDIQEFADAFTLKNKKKKKDT